MLIVVWVGVGADRGVSAGADGDVFIFFCIYRGM